MTFLARYQRIFLCAALLVLAGGCSILESDTIDYKSAGRGTSLEVPPDLTQLQTSSRYTIPGDTVTASGYQAGQDVANRSGVRTAPDTIADVHYMRDGATRWLRVDRPADKIWKELRNFWLDNGFLLTVDQPNTGIMETDWAENRAKIPQDVIRRTLGKVFDSLYSTGERDRFRTRVERNDSGGTDIFITHDGMEEVYTSSQRDSTVWQARPRDRDLEAEFLRRLMVTLGVSEEKSKAMVAQAAAGEASTEARAQVVQVSGAAAVQMPEDFDSAWRRVGLALDRTGFTVEDRDRSRGLYYVRYVDPKLESKKPGFFGKLFGRGSKQLPTERYQIQVESGQTGSVVTVHDKDGGAIPAQDNASIVQILADELK